MPEEVNNRKIVSIIIPCYNGEDFIEETIKSALTQTYSSVELLIINDGSTDKTEEIISTYLDDKRVKYFYKKNEGVSSARNFGLSQSKGEYVIFLDADDMLEPQFLQKRILFLQNSSYYSACCTSSQIINEQGIQQSIFNIGTHDNIISQILSYKTTYATCPSNYLFKKSTLIDNNLFFDTELSSSADRYFLIECSRHFKIGLIYNDHNARLLYRMHTTNMSRLISTSLLNDNRHFMKKVFSLRYIPSHYKRVFRFKIYYILSGGYLKLKKYHLFFLYAVLAILTNPIKFIKQLSAS